MSSTYIILNHNGEPINRIVADQEFVDKYYPGRYRLEEVLEDEEEISSEPPDDETPSSDS